MMNIEQLIACPFYIMDILPMQVSTDCGGQYFKVEHYYLRNIDSLCRKYADVLLKLNCYYDLTLCYDTEQCLKNPEPEKVVQMVSACLSEESAEPCLYISLSEDTMLLTLQSDATHMTIYNPSEKLLHLLDRLALSEGMFVWKPKDK